MYTLQHGTREHIRSGNGHTAISLNSALSPISTHNNVRAIEL